MNNRQAGRRRGRGGQRQGGNPGRPENGNRIDNRARGNAAQLLEKYKNLAQDAQRSGDRVTTEYYLQFADHYFRVLAESRSRFEENNARRQAQDADGEEGDEDYGYEGEAVTPAAQGQQQNYGDENGDEPRRGRDRDNQGGNRREAREPRDDRNGYRRERPRDNGRDAGEREAAEPVEARRAAPVELRRPEPANDPVEAVEAPAEPRRRGRPRRVVEAAPQEEAGFDATLLPPSIAVEAEAAPAEERPRRGRPRRVRTEDEVIPPAA